MIEALHEKMAHLIKMRGHLEYSRTKIRAWWSVGKNFDEWSDEQLESLAAFKARFCELQDHLASCMKMIAKIENQETTVFTHVLNYMVKLYILDSIEQWQETRALRNTATHDYSASEETKAVHFHTLLAHTDYLLAAMDALQKFAANTYPKNK
ncbi:MAG: hypothetical protein ACXWTX_06420 [Gallionella sp.]